MIRSGHQIVDVRRKGGVGKLAFTGAEPGEIESQHRNTVRCQTVRNQPRRLVVFAAGEAVREQSDGADRPVWSVEQRGKLLTLGIGKIEAFGRHAVSSCWRFADGVSQGRPFSRWRLSHQLAHRGV
jgi:hypothetical protein